MAEVKTRSRDSRPVPKLIAESGIPRWTYDATLESQGLLQLREIVTTNGHLLSDGLRHFGLTCDGSGAGRSLSARAAAMFAKVLAAKGTPSYYVPLGDLAREVRRMDYTVADHDPVSAVLSRRGKGYLVIPDFAEVDAFATRSEMHDCLTFLMQHSRQGGGIVIAGMDAKAPYKVDTYGPAFSAFATDFTNLKVA